MSEEKEPLVAFVVLCELAEVQGDVPLGKHAQCWECTFPSVLAEGRDTWKVAINGHETPMPCSLAKQPVEPFHAHVYYNGWPAAILQPYEGVFVRGAGANEDAFVASVRAEIARRAA